MIGVGADTVLAEVLGDLLGRLLQRDIDNARLADALAHPLHQPLALGRTTDRFNPQIEVGAIETGRDDVRFGNREFGLHVSDNIRRSRRRQQQGLRDIELALVVRKLQVVRAKVMPPLGNTVRLVHHQQRNRHLLQKITEALVFQALDRNHQNLQFARLGPGHDCTGVLTALRRINAGRRNPVTLQKRQLVLHQSQQGRNHQRQVGQQQSRQLVAQRLARPRRKDRRRRAPSQHRADRCFLPGTKLWITENLFQGVVHHCHSIDRCKTQNFIARNTVDREKVGGKLRGDDTGSGL